jgi:hypothetical protein
MKPNKAASYKNDVVVLKRIADLNMVLANSLSTMMQRYRETKKYPVIDHPELVDFYNTERVLATALLTSLQLVQDIAYINVCVERFLKGDMTYEEFRVVPCFHKNSVQR